MGRYAGRRGACAWCRINDSQHQALCQQSVSVESRKCHRPRHQLLVVLPWTGAAVHLVTSRTRKEQKLLLLLLLLQPINTKQATTHFKCQPNNTGVLSRIPPGPGRMVEPHHHTLKLVPHPQVSVALGFCRSRQVEGRVSAPAVDAERLPTQVELRSGTPGC